MPRRNMRRNTRRGLLGTAAAGAGAYTPTYFTLDEGTAVFANGANVAAISGSLPKRLTVENSGDYLTDLSAVAQIKAILFGSDNTSLLALMATGTVALKKYPFGSNTSTWSVNCASGSSLWRAAADELWVGRNATSYYKIIESTQVLTTPTQPTGASLLQVVPGGTADRAWQSNFSTTLTEIVVSTGLASGRTITTPAAVTAMFCSNADGTPGIYVNCGSAQGILKYKESDLTLEKTWTVTTAPVSPPGSSVGTELFVDLTGRPWVRNQNAQAIDRFTLAQGAQLAVADRVIHGDASNFGIGPPITGGSAQQQPFCALSSDGKYVAFLTNALDQSTTSRIVRVRNILTQTAKYTRSPGAGYLRQVIAGGQFGGSYGAYTGWRSGDADYRRSRFYYKRVGTDGSPVEVTPGVDLGTSVPLTAGQDLEITVELRYGLGLPGAPAPYVQSLGFLSST